MQDDTEELCSFNIATGFPASKQYLVKDHR